MKAVDRSKHAHGKGRARTCERAPSEHKRPASVRQTADLWSRATCLLLLAACTSPQWTLRNNPTIAGTEPQPPVVITLPGGSPRLAIVHLDPIAELPNGVWLASSGPGPQVLFSNGQNLPASWTAARQLLDALATGNETQARIMGRAASSRVIPVFIPALDPSRTLDVSIRFDPDDGTPMPLYTTPEHIASDLFALVFWGGMHESTEMMLVELQNVHRNGFSIDQHQRTFTDGAAEYVSMMCARAAGQPTFGRRPDVLRERLANGQDTIDLQFWPYGDRAGPIEGETVKYTAAMYVWWRIVTEAEKRGHPRLCADFLKWFGGDHRVYKDTCAWLTERAGFDVAEMVRAIPLADVLAFVETECAHNIVRSTSPK